MIITTDIRYDFLIHTKLIKNVEVVYKKKINGRLAAVQYKPFEVNIVNVQSKEDPKHTIHFNLVEQITIQFFDGHSKPIRIVLHNFYQVLLCFFLHIIIRHKTCIIAVNNSF